MPETGYQTLRDLERLAGALHRAEVSLDVLRSQMVTVAATPAIPVAIRVHAAADRAASIMLLAALFVFFL